VLSAVIFNALIIVALIPLALRGVRFRPVSATALLRRNLLVYGLGGVAQPFAGIKLIDLAVNLLHLARRCTPCQSSPRITAQSALIALRDPVAMVMRGLL
jgi:hypothetical protein